jgi:hypothetical protein
MNGKKMVFSTALTVSSITAPRALHALPEAASNSIAFVFVMALSPLRAAFGSPHLS